MERDDEQGWKAEIARRLKAGRWLAGSVETSGKGKLVVCALSNEELAERPPLRENKITASLLGSIERMERVTLPMELAAIAEALGMPRDYFSAPLLASTRADDASSWASAFSDAGPAAVQGAQGPQRPEAGSPQRHQDPDAGSSGTA